jgi:hypothetical protein
MTAEEIATDIIAVFMHPQDPQYEEVLEAIVERIQKLERRPRG